MTVTKDTFLMLNPSTDAGEWREAWHRLELLAPTPCPRTLNAAPGAACEAECLPGIACGEQWQYMGTGPTPHRDWRINPERGASLVHSFRHRCGKGHGLRAYVNVPASPGWAPRASSVLS